MISTIDRGLDFPSLYPQQLSFCKELAIKYKVNIQSNICTAFPIFQNKNKRLDVKLQVMSSYV